MTDPTGTSSDDASTDPQTGSQAAQSEQTGPTGTPATSGQKTRGRAGRDLGAAIGIGLALGAVALATLFLYRPAWGLLVAIAVTLAIWEIVRAVGSAGIVVPLFPPIAGAWAMVALAWLRGLDGLTIALMLTILATIVWRMSDSAKGYLTATSVGVFIAVYIPFLAGFAVMLAVPHDGAARVLAFLGAVVCSDTGGYAAGVLVGKHPMAPTISPKKSWEGLAGSVITSAVFGSLMFALCFQVDWWKGAVYGVAIAGCATLGDLGESMIKRDIGVKDMGTLLPGHGGVMDRMDSLLPSAAVAWLLIAAFVP